MSIGKFGTSIEHMTMNAEMVGMISVTDRLNQKEGAHPFVKRGGGYVNVTGCFLGVGPQGYGTNSTKG
jgi:hypothetical protein